MVGFKAIERIVCYADLGDELGPIPFRQAQDEGSDVRPPEPISPDWLAITHIPELPHVAESYTLYYLERNGRILGVVEFGSLEDALARACLDSGLRETDWRICFVRVPAGGYIRRDLCPA